MKVPCLLVICRTLSLALGLLLLEVERWHGQPGFPFPFANPYSNQGAPNAGEEKSQVSSLLGDHSQCRKISLALGGGVGCGPSSRSQPFGAAYLEVRKGVQLGNVRPDHQSETLSVLRNVPFAV